VTFPVNEPRLVSIPEALFCTLPITEAAKSEPGKCGSDGPPILIGPEGPEEPCGIEGA
jgi:hypothetical protein